MSYSLLPKDHIFLKFPERILHLNELLKMPEFCIAEMNINYSFDLLPMKGENNSNIYEGENTIKPSPDSNSNASIPVQGTVPTNNNINHGINIMKPYIKLLSEDTDALKIWVTLLKPKIEDGNNFGVDVQEDVLADIETVNLDAATYYDKISFYYSSRAKLVSKVLKYPYIEDYQRAVEELDERQHLAMSIILHDIRNHYSKLHDLVTKNFEKIVKPRSSNTDSLY